jgi:hypothetical protein
MMISGGETKVYWKNYKSTWTALGLTLGLQCEKLVSNHCYMALQGMNLKKKLNYWQLSL